MAGELVRPVSIFQRWMLEAAREISWLSGPWFTMNAVVSVTGPFDRRVLETALAELLRRHEVLRTRVVEDDGGAVQVVSGKIKAVVQDGDGSLHAPVDAGSPVVVRLVRVGAGEHLLYLHLHHMIADPETVWSVLNELGALYTAYVSGGVLPDGPAAQYGEYAEFEEEQSRSGVEAARRWWTEAIVGHEFGAVRLGGAPYAYRDVLLSPGELSAAHRVARGHRGTISTTLFAALGCAMRSYVGDSRIMFTTVFRKRDRPEWRNVFGPCILPALVPLPAPPSVLDVEYGQRVRDTLLGCQRHCRFDMGEVRGMTEFEPMNGMPFFEYVPDRWPSTVRFGEAMACVVNAAGPKDLGDASGFVIRARENNDGALSAHVSGDAWGEETARKILGGLATQIDQAMQPA
ncbi:condensation domain-containing protein [Actinokineospora enzanensis]|uniref:condensation domain-containing protein n=1 Tax=Actinokineospora enzanensis TaxID=155975 RepID=UPI00039ABB77|nr:condensation domain-containing protein [Actinokineospora enzanensis]